jgi:DNA-binding FadR family transcriptional regulator
VGAKTEHVERSIRALIDSGDLGPGGRLPSERHLAEQLSAGRTPDLGHDLALINFAGR